MLTWRRENMNLKTGKKSGKMKQKIKEMKKQIEENKMFRKKKMDKLLSGKSIHLSDKGNEEAGK